MNGGINIRLLICRTCLKLRKPLHNIFYYYKNSRLVSDMLKELTTIKVQKDDGLPVNICSYCLDKLSSACDFNAMIIASDVKLHNFYSISEAEQTNDTLNVDLKFVKEETIIKNDKINSADENCLNNAQGVNVDGNLLEKNQSRRSNQNEEVIKQEDMEEDKVSIQIGCDKDTVQDDYDESNYSSDMSDDESSSSAESIVQVMHENNSTSEQMLVKSNLPSESKCTSDTATELLKEKEQMNSSDDEVEQNSPIKSLNISEYEKLKTTLSKSEKDRAKLFCKLCNKSFGFRYYFEMHLPQHTGQLPHKCETCNASFAIPYLLKLHKRRHTDLKPYSCEVCGKAFKYLGGLHTHKQLHSSKPSHKCDLCTKSFRQINNLRIHLRRHKGEKSFVCDECGKTFTTREGLHNHKILHNADVSFSCSTCARVYRSKRALLNHAKTHLEVKPYLCDHCNKRFSCNAILKNHVLIHTGEKPYSCKLCGKCFRQKSVVRNHMRIHTGETPYPCERCPMQFKYAHHLRNHMKVHK